MKLFIYSVLVLFTLYAYTCHANEYSDKSSVKSIKTVKLTANDTDNHDECMVKAQMYIGKRQRKEIKKCKERIK